MPNVATFISTYVVVSHLFLFIASYVCCTLASWLIGSKLTTIVQLAEQLAFTFSYTACTQ